MSTDFGQFELICPLAAGGMAVTHLARLRGDDPGREFVLKRIRPEIASEDELRDLFRVEASIAKGLTHPNIVRTLHDGDVEGELYLVLEYVWGADLRDVGKAARKQGVPIPPTLIARIIADAARGLHFAHEYRVRGARIGLVHRDVSPPNIMVGFDGTVSVIDFGIARVEREFQRVRQGQLKGKFAYMSPEQVEGLAIDRRSDIFSLGILLWEFTVGRRLFKATSNIATMTAIAAAEVQPPTTIHPEYDSALEAIVLKALARDPAARFQRADDLASALDDWLKTQPQCDVGEWTSTLFQARINELRELTGAVYDGRVYAPDFDRMEPKMDSSDDSLHQRPRDGEIKSAAHELLPDPGADPFMKANRGSGAVLGFFALIGLAVIAFIIFKIATDGLGTTHLADADVSPNIEAVDVEFVPPPPLPRLATEVQSTPPGALIVANTIATGLRTPAQVDLVEGETNVLSLHLDGHRTLFIETTAGELANGVLVELPPAPPAPPIADVPNDGSGDGSGEVLNPPPPAGHGRIRVIARDTSGQSVPAEVLVNGESAGTAPLTVDVPARLQTHITARAEGLRDSVAYAAPVAWTSVNSEAEVILEMTRDAGVANRWTTARLRTTPRESSVTINGEPNVLSLMMNLSSSEFHLIRATAPDHQPSVRAIDGSTGQISFVMALEPIIQGPATLSLTSVPLEGVTVFVEPIRHGSAGPSQIDLPLVDVGYPGGDYRVTLEHRSEETGRTRGRFEINVSPGHANRFSFAMTDEGEFIIAEETHTPAE